MRVSTYCCQCVLQTDNLWWGRRTRFVVQTLLQSLSLGCEQTQGWLHGGMYWGKVGRRAIWAPLRATWKSTQSTTPMKQSSLHTILAYWHGNILYPDFIRYIFHLLYWNVLEVLMHHSIFIEWYFMNVEFESEAGTLPWRNLKHCSQFNLSVTSVTAIYYDSTVKRVFQLCCEFLPQ